MAFLSSLGTTPFKLVYGRDPPSMKAYEPGNARAPAVDPLLQDRDDFLLAARECLLQAQDHAKLYYDAKHTPLEFEVSAWVWVKLLYRPSASLPAASKGKLAPRFYGLYQILERIGDVAYRVRLPASARIRNVFHVGVLKAFRGTPPAEAPPLPPMLNGHVMPIPSAMLRSRLVRGRLQVLVSWAGLAASEATWEPVAAFKQQYPSFEL